MSKNQPEPTYMATGFLTEFGEKILGLDEKSEIVAVLKKLLAEHTEKDCLVVQMEAGGDQLWVFRDASSIRVSDGKFEALTPNDRIREIVKYWEEGKGEIQ